MAIKTAMAGVKVTAEKIINSLSPTPLNKLNAVGYFPMAFILKHYFYDFSLESSSSEADFGLILNL